MSLVLRQSLISVKPGHMKDVERLFDEFEENSSKQKGYILGFRYTMPEQPDILAHIDVWASPEALSTSTIQDHILYLSSQLMNYSDSQKNVRKQYTIHGTTKNFPKPVA